MKGFKMRIEKPEKTIHFPSMELSVLEKWDNESTFRKSVESRSAEKSYNFYDGPPFATGLPHFGHFLPSAIKDAFPRYFTMKGHRVDRRFGWDCHGVPVELLVQKELGLNGPAEIEALGIAKFNDACRASVLRYTTEWRVYMRRLGRWVDMDNEYRTMDLNYMESVWAVVKSLYDKGLLYEGRQVMSFSSALSSSLSNFEASLDYRDVQDPSLTVKAKLQGAKWAGKSLLVWTTTPWTLPANLAVAIDAKAIYAEVRAGEEDFILLESRVSGYFTDPAKFHITRTFLGQEMVGLRYEPFVPGFEEEKGPNAFQVLGVNYVEHGTGTGAVHTAPAFGEDDFKCAKEHDLPIFDHLDQSGCYLKGNLPELVGLVFKEGDKVVLAHLKQKGLTFKHETFVHSYPFCYRSGAPLMFRAMPSWFVSVEKLKAQLQKNNQEVAWVPEHIQSGRFGKWLEGARDWNIGRTRYWGTPIPIWKNIETGETICLGSVADLQKHADHKVTDLHMEHIDEITIPSATGNTKLKRVPFVLDCWFESGAMPYAQSHFPFENKEDFEKRFPADFICEGLDQTRGWFYTLNVLSAALFGKPAAKNIVVNGLVMASDGKKMSKSLKNYADPLETLESLGADSVRLFLLTSPGTHGEEVRFSVEAVKENTRKVLLPLWNAYSFLSTYASIEGFDPEKDLVPVNQLSNELDRWVKVKCKEMMIKLDEAMTTYHIAKAAPLIVDFLDDLNNWYIRRSRRRFWNADKQAFSALYEVLVKVTQAMAPFAPFAAEHFFGKLALTKTHREAGSVHLSLLENETPLSKDEKALLVKVSLARRVVELGRNIRTIHKLKNRQPLQRITVGVMSQQHADLVTSLKDVICEELNVKTLVVTLKTEEMATILVKPNFKVLGKTMGEKMKPLQEALAALPKDLALLALTKQTFKLVDAVRGLDLELKPEMLTVELRAAGEDLVATEADLVVALDPNISEELRLEGLARELVSHIQKARKSAGYEVEDRILLKIQTSEKLMSALDKNRMYIEDETLSQFSDDATVEGIETVVDLEGEQVSFKVLCIKKDV
jgi:isoleucyl-tRNA synthetase